MDDCIEFERKSLYSNGLGYLINQARNAILLSMEQELAPLDVTAAQFIVVLGIAHKRARTPTEISRLLGSDSGAMTRLLDRLERKGIIRRVRSMEDRRAVHIVLTSKGMNLHPQIMDAVAKVLNALLKDFTPEELIEFRRLLAKFADAGTRFFLPI